jgi:hypothetical protein
LAWAIPVISKDAEGNEVIEKKLPPSHAGTVRVFQQEVTLEDAVGSYACSLEGIRRVTNGIPLGGALSCRFTLVNCVETLKVQPRL